jgi:hypothetical protein
MPLYMADRKTVKGDLNYYSTTECEISGSHGGA